MTTRNIPASNIPTAEPEPVGPIDEREDEEEERLVGEGLADRLPGISKVREGQSRESEGGSRLTQQERFDIYEDIPVVGSAFGAVRSLREGQDPDSPGGERLTAEERRSIYYPAAETAVVATPVRGVGAVTQFVRTRGGRRTVARTADDIEPTPAPAPTARVVDQTGRTVGQRPTVVNARGTRTTAGTGSNVVSNIARSRALTRTTRTRPLTRTPKSRGVPELPAVRPRVTPPRPRQTPPRTRGSTRTSPRGRGSNRPVGGAFPIGGGGGGGSSGGGGGTPSVAGGAGVTPKPRATGKYAEVSEWDNQITTQYNHKTGRSSTFIREGANPAGNARVVKTSKTKPRKEAVLVGNVRVSSNQQGRGRTNYSNVTPRRRSHRPRRKGMRPDMRMGNKRGRRSRR